MRYPPWLVGTAVAVLIAGLTSVLLTALFVSVMIVSVPLGLVLFAVGTAGAVPVLAAYRGRPVARWFCAGIACGIAIGWLAVIAVLVSGAVG